MYWERYVNNIEPVNKTSTGFGTRMHQLLEHRHQTMMDSLYPCVAYPPVEPVELEAEAQLTFAAYEAHYPVEPFEVVGVERYFEVPLPCSQCLETFGKVYDEEDSCAHHIYCGEFDGIVRMKDSGRLWLLETKTEKRGGKDNLPVAWQQKSQVGLYLWAAEQVYDEQFEGILLNVITRQSPKGECKPAFRRDPLVRTTSQQLEAVRNITWIADQIEQMERTGIWIANRNECVNKYGWSCDYLPLHATKERSEELVQLRYKPADEYLSGL